jgi:hypothetical protein
MEPLLHVILQWPKNFCMQCPCRIGSCTLSGVEGLDVEEVIRNGGHHLDVLLLHGLRHKLPEPGTSYWIEEPEN